MAVKESLEFDLRGALAQVGILEREINDLRKPVKIPIDVTGNAVRDFRTIDEKLADVESGVKEVNLELSAMELAAGRSVGDFSRLAQEMGIAEGQAADLAGEILESRNSSLRVAEAAKDVARQMGLSEDEARRFADEVGKAAGKVDQLDQAAGKASGGGLAKLGAGLKTLLVSAAAFVGVREIFSFLNSSVQAFSNLEESSSKANVVFGDFADTVFRFTANAPEELGSTSAAAIEAASSFGNLFLGIGLGQKVAADMSVTLVQLATDLASFNNISVQDAMEKLRSGLIGEAEPLRSVGVLLSEAAVASKALELGLGGVTGKLTEAEKVQARYAIILDQTTTAQGDFARTADGVANTQRRVAASFEELKTSIGEAILPLFQTLLDAIPPLVKQFEEMVPAIQSMATSIADISTIGGPTLGFLLRLDSELLQLGGILSEVAAIDIGDFSFGGVRDIFTFSAAMRGAREAIAAGVQPARVFNEGLKILTERANISTKALHDLADTTGATALEQAEAIRILLNTPGDTTAEELITLRNALTDLEDQIAGTADAFEHYQFIAATIKEVPPLFPDPTTFTTFSTDVDLAAKNAADDLQELADAAAAQAQRTAEAFDLFAEQPAKIATSFRQGIEDLRLAVQEQLDFDVNIAILRALNLDALADEFQRIGVAGIDQLADAVNTALTDLPTAIEADRLLQGFAGLGEDMFNALVDKFIASGLTPADARKLADSLVSPEVIAAATKAGGRVGAAQAEGTISEYREALFREAQQIDATQIRDAINDRVAESFDASDQAEFEATATVTAWEAQAILEAERISKADLQARLGDLFSDVNFVITADQFQFPTSFTGAIDLLLHPTATVSGSGVTIYQNFTGPIQDLNTQVAQAAQSTAAVANLFNRVGPN